MDTDRGLGTPSALKGNNTSMLNLPTDPNLKNFRRLSLPHKFEDIHLMSKKSQNMLKAAASTCSTSSSSSSIAMLTSSNNRSHSRGHSRRGSTTIPDKKSDTPPVPPGGNRSSELPDSGSKGQKLSLKACAKACGMAIDSFCRIRKATGFTEEEILKKHEEFEAKFGNGVVTYKEFVQVSRESGVGEEDLEDFVEDVFTLFDINGDKVLTFEEFTFAMSASNFQGIKAKLVWLFDQVYDEKQSGALTQEDMSDILTNLMLLNGYTQERADRLIDEFMWSRFGANKNILIDREKFLELITSSRVLTKILTTVSDDQRRLSIASDVGPPINDEDIPEPVARSRAKSYSLQGT